MTDQADGLQATGGEQQQQNWPDHWKASGQPWRKSPPITVERAETLSSRHGRTNDGCHYDLSGLTLSRADVEWLAAEHAVQGCAGPLRLVRADLRELDLSELPLDGVILQSARLGKANLQRAVLIGSDLSAADLRGADCRKANLQGANLGEARLDAARLEGALLMEANLTRAQLPRAHLKRARLASANFEGANLIGADLDDADLAAACLDRAKLLEASLQRSHLQWGRLRGADLAEAVMCDAKLWAADLQGARLAGAQLNNANFHDVHLEGADLIGACLQGTDFTGAYFDSATALRGVDASGDRKRPDSGVTVVDLHWNEVNLSVIDWSKVAVLGDEVRALRRDRRQGAPPPADAYTRAARANRQVAMQLQEQGMNEEANRFSFRAQVMQRRALYHQRKRGPYLFSLFLSALSGYGYRFGRGFVAYLIVVVAFATAYLLFGQLDPAGAFVASINAFHGRGFQPGTLKASDLLWLVSAAEAFIGLIIEVVLIATLTQRLFGR